jgi:hypothetical protein
MADCDRESDWLPMSDLFWLIWCALIGLFRCRGCVGSRDACCGTFSRTAGRDKEFIQQRVYGMDEVRKEVEN